MIADEGQCEDDEDLAAGPRVRIAAVDGSPAHQLTTIVVSEPSPSRPFASRGSNCAISGMMRSW